MDLGRSVGYGCVIERGGAGEGARGREGDLGMEDALMASGDDGSLSPCDKGWVSGFKFVSALADALVGTDVVG